jgi:competence protein ComFB
MSLQNVTETLVRFLFDDAFRNTGKLACTCEQCRDDILAFALNRLPPRYVSSDLGHAYVKTQYMSSQLQSDIVSELARAAEIVRDRPRHGVMVDGQENLQSQDDPHAG